MAGTDPQMLEKARRARDVVARQLLSHPDVSLIDIGYDPESTGSPRRLAVRVHVRRMLDLEALEIPSEIDGIPVCIMAGDYHLE